LRRLAPRPLRAALEGAVREAAPAGTLAGVQAVWAEAAGAAVASESQPVSERDGVVTVACRSAVWAQELELLAADIVARLNAILGAGDGVRAVSALRFETRSGRWP
jgi:predicted nucleic acid-binding Zn ribbon protein